jgi:hypothetical protein
MISEAGHLCPYVGWVVQADHPQDAIKMVERLGIDNGPEGEFSLYTEFTADILEFNKGVAQL